MRCRVEVAAVASCGRVASSMGWISAGVYDEELKVNTDELWCWREVDGLKDGGSG